MAARILDLDANDLIGSDVRGPFSVSRADRASYQARIVRAVYRGSSVALLRWDGAIVDSEDEKSLCAWAVKAFSALLEFRRAVPLLPAPSAPSAEVAHFWLTFAAAMPPLSLPVSARPWFGEKVHGRGVDGFLGEILAYDSAEASFPRDVVGYAVDVDVAKRAALLAEMTEYAALLKRLGRHRTANAAEAAADAWTGDRRTSARLRRLGGWLRDVGEVGGVVAREPVRRAPAKAKRPTFAEGRAALMALMDRQMWVVTTYSRGHDLKVPYATDQLGTTRVWFHPQTLYIQENDSRRDAFDAASARSTGVDLRDEPAAILRALGLAPRPSAVTDDIPPPPPPVVRPAGFGVEETEGKRKGQIRMFNPGKLVWLPYLDGGAPSLKLKAKTDERSGAYAIRRKDSGGVVYVGESHQGHMWRTIARHFQSPATFTARKKPGGANAFATDRPEDYEVAYRVTSRGYRDHPHGDQRAMGLQARWIRDFRAAGHRLHNRDDGLSSAEVTAGYRAHAEKQRAEEASRGAFDGLLNPKPRGALTMLGLLTGLETARGLVIRWSLKDAPWLTYDAAGRLHVVYPGRVVRGSTDAEIAEYKRSHWGQLPSGKVRSGGVAVAPFVSLGDAVRIVYTTKKGTDSKLVDYVHPFGKRGRGCPTLVEHRCPGGCVVGCGAAGSLALSGGVYRMTPHGIVD